MWDRRRFLLHLPALAALPHTLGSDALAQSFRTRFHRRPPAPPAPSVVYFGTDTTRGIAKGIYTARFDAVTGRLSTPMLAAATARPSYMALSAPTQGRRRLYAVNAIQNDAATVTSYLMEQTSGALHPLNQVPAGGMGPAYISLDATGRAAFVADYYGAAIATYHIGPDGRLAGPVQRIDYKDAAYGRRGPVAARQDLPHPHSVHLSPDNRFLLVNDLGSDAITVFAVDSFAAHLGPPASFHCRPGSGPRHLAFHPNARWVYSLNEIDSTIDQFLWTTTASRTQPQGLLVNTARTVKTIAPGFPEAKNTAAELAVSSDGNYLYASNRGEDTLVVYAIADADGALKPVQRISCGGKTPRHFALDPTERWIVCGNQDSGTVTVFRRDGASGRLGGPMQAMKLDSVLFTLFA